MASKIFYKWSFYRRFFKYCSPLIRIGEKGKIRKYAEMKNKSFPVFILGLPRSGSTILYQLLTSMYDVLYFDNLMVLGRENLYYSTRMSQRRFGSKGHKSYRSNYGNTEADGLHAPAEAGQFWYRWIPEDAVIVDGDSLDDQSKRELRDTLQSIINRYDKPLIIKNLYSTLRIGLIDELFPEARFIYLKREPLAVAESIYRGRKKNLSDITEWWSVPVPGYQDLAGEPVELQIATQVHDLDQMIQSALEKMDPSRVMELNYEELAREISNKELGEFLHAGKRQDFTEAEGMIKSSDSRKTDDELLEKLKIEIDKLYSK